MDDYIPAIPKKQAEIGMDVPGFFLVPFTA
jgi:hypothetical protein